jgi:hypothetical protein
MLSADEDDQNFLKAKRNSEVMLLDDLHQYNSAQSTPYNNKVTIIN